MPQHGAILDAIKRGDPEGARNAFRVLLTRSEADAIAASARREKAMHSANPR